MISSNSCAHISLTMKEEIFDILSYTCSERASLRLKYHNIILALATHNDDFLIIQWKNYRELSRIEHLVLLGLYKLPGDKAAS